MRPRILIPVHGEALHLHEHARLARELLVPEVVRCENGDLVRLSPGPATIVDEVPAARLYKDGRLIVESVGRTIPDRRRLGFAGLVSIAIAMTQEGDFAADPEIALTGIPERNAEGDLMADVAHDAVVDTIGQLPRGRRRDKEAVRGAVMAAVRAALAASWGKKPVCHVHVLTL